MFLIDKVGRKLLLIVGMFGIAISMFLLSYGFGSATYTLTEKSISEFPAEIDKQKLESLQNATFTNLIVDSNRPLRMHWVRMTL